MIFNIEKYKKTLEFAAKKHGDQKTPTGYPYLLHVTSVAAEVINAQPENIDLAISCALLHDVIEDTEGTYQEILLDFGKEVADGVFALTKDKRLAKEDQMANSLLKLEKEPIDVQCVKLADRITNLSSIPFNWTFEKKEKYLKESILIYETLKHSNEFLADRLKEKIDTYKSKY